MALQVGTPFLLNCMPSMAMIMIRKMKMTMSILTRPLPHHTPYYMCLLSLFIVCYDKEAIDSVYTHFAELSSLMTEIIMDGENSMDKCLQFERIVNVTDEKKSILQIFLELLRQVADAHTQHVSDHTGWGFLFT